MIHEENPALKELLSLVIGKEVEDLEIENNCLNYEIVSPQNKGEYHTSGINLDTLDRLCLEWCWKQGYSLAIQYEWTGIMLITSTKLIKGFNKEADSRPTIKATEWVAKEKGLM